MKGGNDSSISVVTVGSLNLHLSSDLILNLKDLEVSEISVFIDLLENIFETEGFTVSIRTLNKLKEN